VENDGAVNQVPDGKTAEDDAGDVEKECAVNQVPDGKLWIMMISWT